MSIVIRFEVKCDGCGHSMPDQDEVEHEGDVLLPEGWVETMTGDHLCRVCKP